MEDYEIDEFEKLYVLSVAELNSSVEISDRTFDEKNFDRICNLAKFKKDHPEMFDKENQKIIDDDMNYYVIPRIIKQKIRNGDEEIVVEKEAYVLIDSSGNNIGLILENGDILRKENEKEVTKKSQELNLEENQDEIQEETQETKALEETNNEEDKEIDTINNTVRNNNKSRVYEEAEAIGISQEIIDSISKKRNCRVDQINIRKIENLEKIKEDTGLELKQYREKIVALRINYGSEYRYYIVNSETGEFFNPRPMEANREDIPEVEDYFKYRFRPGVEESRPLRTNEGTSYMSYLGSNGEIKSMRYLNNGKEDDMVKEEREKYLAEVEKANNVLAEAIDEYQNVNSYENWLKVKSAMKARVYVDKKYNVLENQKEVTKDTLKETADETLVKYGNSKKDEKEEDDPRLSRDDPRWW